MIACENSGHDASADFPEVRKIVEAGAATKGIVDYELSRYACYLIVQNGDPRKEVIALGQTYLPSKPIGRKWQTVSTSWTKTAADWSCAAISSNGISCLPKLPGMPV